METKKCLAVWVSMASHQFIASKFIKMVLKYKNKPTFIVDRVWYKNFKDWALITKTFGRRNIVEQFFSLLKSRTKRFYNRFPENKIKFRSTLS